jgi:hypothetical protein
VVDVVDHDFFYPLSRRTPMESGILENQGMRYHERSLPEIRGVFLREMAEDEFGTERFQGCTLEEIHEHLASYVCPDGSLHQIWLKDAQCDSYDLLRQTEAETLARVAKWRTSMFQRRPSQLRNGWLASDQEEEEEELELTDVSMELISESELCVAAVPGRSDEDEEGLGLGEASMEVESEDEFCVEASLDFSGEEDFDLIGAIDEALRLYSDDSADELVLAAPKAPSNEASESGVWSLGSDQYCCDSLVDGCAFGAQVVLPRTPQGTRPPKEERRSFQEEEEEEEDIVVRGKLENPFLVECRERCWTPITELYEEAAQSDDEDMDEMVTKKCTLAEEEAFWCC